MLVADGRIPRFEGEAHRLPDVLAAFTPLIGTPVYLRLAAQVELAPERFVRLHIFDVGEGEARAFDEVEVPAELRPDFDAWVAEQRGAPVPELRSTWARPGW